MFKMARSCIMGSWIGQQNIQFENWKGIINKDLLQCNGSANSTEDHNSLKKILPKV